MYQGFCEFCILYIISLYNKINIFKFRTMLIRLVVLLVSVELQFVKSISFMPNLSGCFTVPQVCPNKNITFWLYTREKQDKPYQLDLTKKETITDAPFAPDADFKFLIHGYTGYRDYSPNTEIRPALFQHGEYNVISLDYGPIVKSPCYLNAVKNIKVVANCTANLIDYLVKHAKIPLSKFHIIGFSLGAHVTGLISEFLKSGVLDRMTGLDPAMPLFWGNDPHQKLDPTDAKFVDVIHTNALAKGKLETCGDVDFYCNNGRDQPGCDAPEIENEDSCNHARAPAYYAESINSKVGFWATSCGALSTVLVFSKKNCTVQVMGFHVPISAKGSYYLSTNAAPPFALGNVTGTENGSTN